MSDQNMNAAAAYVAVPESGGGAGVLVLHAWWGLTPVFKDLCDRLARAGFVAVAPDLYGGATANTIEAAERLIDGMDGAAAKARILAAVDFLHENAAVQGDRVGVIGFSMGGAWAITLSALRPDAIAAVVVFYSSGEADFSLARAAFLGHYAPDDPWEPSEGVAALEAALRAAGRDVTFYTYPGMAHWFFEHNRPEYDAQAAELAWERTLAFLRRHLA